jgi:uncharacterized membrane protein YkoI
MRFSYFGFLALALLCATPALSSERKACLSRAERSVLIATKKAVPLGRAMRVVKARIGGDVVKARLCRQGRALVYVLTVLARSGKVIQARVDAVDGHWLDGR